MLISHKDIIKNTVRLHQHRGQQNLKHKVEKHKLQQQVAAHSLQVGQDKSLQLMHTGTLLKRSQQNQLMLMESILDQ